MFTDHVKVVLSVEICVRYVNGFSYSFTTFIHCDTLFAIVRVLVMFKKEFQLFDPHVLVRNYILKFYVICML